jgi:hypothetical protein
MSQANIHSWHEHGHADATKKSDAELPVPSKIDFLLALSIGSVAFGIVLLVLIAVYLLNGMSAEALAIWICCAVVAAALMMLGGSLFLLWKGITRNRSGNRQAA